MTPLTPIESIIYTAERLGSLRDEVVFLGGAVVGLLITEPGGVPPRATKDVDVVMEIASRVAYYKVDGRLRALGFVNDMRGPVCRYLHGSVLVDIMPTHTDVLGFSNQWYPLAVQSADRYTIREGTEINLISAPSFLATKIEAFFDKNREASGDIFLSRDFADIVQVIDGRPEVVAETMAAPPEVRAFLREKFGMLLQDQYIEEAIVQHIDAGREGFVPHALNLCWPKLRRNSSSMGRNRQVPRCLVI